MKLATLIQDLPQARVLGDVEIAVRALEEDSRRIGPGDVFVAVRGRRSDGHAYLAQVIEQGAAAVVVEQPIADPALAARVTQVVVPSTARALGVLAAAMVGNPGERLGLVGITGTNGKTTTAYLTEAVLAAAGALPGVIGTVSYRYGDVVVPAPYTTPTAPVLQGVLADMARASCTHAVLEVSSAALAMDRLAGVRFRVAAFTNFTQDHLDVHGSMDAYLEAKQRLFRDHLAPDGTAVINIDDDAAPAMIAATRAAGAQRILRVSARGREDAEVRVIEAETSIDGIRATLATPRGPVTVESRALLGHYNIANLAVTVGIGEALGLDHAAVARGIAGMPGVPGRVERVPNPAGLDILVDYAHTPDAIDNVLAALRPLTRRRLICVFGCGGDRDPDKRPKMGAAAARGADLVIVTSDNPRTEEPEAIIEQILPGVPAPFFVHVDRRVAIAAAVFEAVPGDIVLIAGKGHENYQIFGAEKVHFDDREEAVHATRARWRFPADELARVAGGTITHRPAHEPEPVFTRVLLDGRDSAPGDLYVAIRGDRFDGHDFCVQAVQAGAAGVVVERGRAPRGPDGAVLDTTVIEVDDTRLAMGAMARWHRQRWAEAQGYPERAPGAQPRFRPVVGVTGSAGKTTTKELIAAALSARHAVQATRGSLNNETGVPLTLLGLMPHHDAAVIEMGMRGLGQIAYLAQLAAPAVGAVTNAGTAHIGVVGSADGIVQGKSEIFAALGDNGTAVFPGDDARLAGRAEVAPRRLRFGGLDHDRAAPPEVAAVDYALVHLAGDTLGAEITFALHGAAVPADGNADGTADGNDRVVARLHLVGRHNATNAACALACAIAAGVPAAAAARALSRARPPALRGQIRSIAGRHVLVDCYNANPASMRVALATVDELARTHGGRAVAVLGDMLELGDEAPTAHAEIGREAAGRGIAVIGLGEHGPALAGATPAAPGTTAARDVEAAAAAALAAASTGDWILVKASRGMRLERVIEAMQRLAANHIDTPSREA